MAFPSVPVTTAVYTDGACSGNPGPGGWAWVVPEGVFASGADPRTTNQRMELTAVLEALGALDGPLDVISDSTYVVNCFRDRWWEGWIERGWRTTKKKPVANRDLWEPLVDLVRSRGDVEFRWVKGHAGDRWNDLADRLATEAVRTRKPRSGDRPPTEIDEAEDADPTAATDGDFPEGHRLVVAGHRPPEIGGYDPNPLADAVRRRLVEILAAKREMHSDLVVLVGLGLGVEQLGAEAAVEVRASYVAVLPYPDPDAPWPPASRRRFRTLLGDAADVRVLQKENPESKRRAGASLARRDAWLARAAAEAIVVWDGEDAAIGRQFRTFEDRLGEDVWRLDPTELRL